MEILRLAAGEDWEAVNRIGAQVQALHASWAPDAYESTDAPYPMEYLLEDIQDKCLWVAVMENSVVGYVRFRIWKTNGIGCRKRKFLQIEDIGVEETLRHRGIGRSMMADLKEIALDQGCTNMNLYVDVKNETAFAYYKSCGFHVSNIGMQMKL